MAISGGGSDTNMISARIFKGQWADGPGWRKGIYERWSEKKIRKQQCIMGRALDRASGQMDSAFSSATN